MDSASGLSAEGERRGGGKKEGREVSGEALRYGNVLGLVPDHCLQIKFYFA